MIQTEIFDTIVNFTPSNFHVKLIIYIFESTNSE